MKNNKTIYQYSTFNGLLNKVYIGNEKISSALSKGKFGIGTTNNLKGEIIFIENKAFYFDKNLNAKLLDKDVLTPFYVVSNTNSKFKNLKLNQKINLLELEKLIEKKYNILNYPVLILLKAEFKYINLRTFTGTKEPYEKLSKIIKDIQIEKHFKNINGIAVGFWIPKHLQNINNKGLHIHFIDNNHLYGGHVLDLEIENDFKIIVEEKENFNISFPNNILFKESNLT